MWAIIWRSGIRLPLIPLNNVILLNVDSSKTDKTSVVMLLATSQKIFVRTAVFAYFCFKFFFLFCTAFGKSTALYLHVRFHCVLQFSKNSYMFTVN